MEGTIHQPTKNPTNKVMAATAGTAAWGMFMSILGLTLKNLFPEWYDPEVLLSVSAGMPTVIAFAAGWFTKDAPNQIVIVEPRGGEA